MNRHVRHLLKSAAFYLSLAFGGAVLAFVAIWLLQEFPYVSIH